jgi:(p)ppGpp synthase/HD superfamily hydrolase
MFATAAHTACGHVRKYTGKPYIVHPAEVVGLIVRHAERFNQAMIEAAWLHDVVEDTEVGLGLILDEFGDEVMSLVGWLTDVSTPFMGNRAYRKALDREHIAAAPAAAKTIKLADLISNTRSIVADDPKFAVTYLSEKRLLLEVLREGDEILYHMAKVLAH